MMIFPGVMTAAGGVFLFLWYRTVVGLPVKQQAHFIRPAAFKWGIPAVSLTMFSAGIFLLAGVSVPAAVTAVLASALFSFLIIRFDRYSANLRVIYDHYRGIRQAYPGLEEVEILFRTARWRYPQWSHDRLLELVAGKDIQSLLLLMIINEFEINPLRDWELYRTLKIKAASIVQQDN